MIFFVLSLLVQAGLIVHVIRTGRNTLWIWAIALLPAAGSAAYIVVELLPELFGSGSARRASRSMRRLIDPDRDLREASAAVALSGNVDARRRLAEQLFQRGDYERSIAVCQEGLRGVFEHDPTLLYGLARAQFAAGQFTAARDSLARLRLHENGLGSPEVGLLYARSLEAAGDLAQAQQEYAAIAPGFPGAEARVRYALLLKRLGRTQEAERLLRELLDAAQLAPRHYRKAQAEWLDRAAAELG
ncbi:MAG: tetratricopeptide repeat protein [Steroidobacterales bacterium]